jgi:hypothetical protein
VLQLPDAVDTIVCAPDDRWKYHPKHVDQFPDINKLCNVASCWIYIGILLAHPIIHISRIRVSTAIETRPQRSLYLHTADSKVTYHYSERFHIIQQILSLYIVPIQAIYATNTVRVVLPAGPSSVTFP